MWHLSPSFFPLIICCIFKVLDACSAPGNKTVHLSALMKGKGKIVACELNKDRVNLLRNTIQVAGANSILCFQFHRLTSMHLITSSVYFVNC